MKVTFFIYSLTGGGAERVTAHLANYWSEQGHEVTILTCLSSVQGAYEVADDVIVQSLNVAAKSQNALAGLLNNLKRVQKLRSEIKRTSPDVLISMMTTSNVLAAIACRGLNVRCIGSERNFPGHTPLSPFWSKLRKHSYSRLDALVSQTKAAKTWLEDHTRASHVQTIHNPVVFPLPIQSPVASPPEKGNTRVILGVGRLTKVKQFDHLIKIFEGFHHDHSQWRLVIIGSGEEQNNLQNLINALSLQNSVMLQPRVGNLSDWYTYADVIAMTSLAEGFPNSLIEGMAYGKTVISYDCLAGPAEIIDHQRTGILVTPNNQNEFQNELTILAADKNLRTTLGKNAESIKNKLAIEKIARQWEGLFDDTGVSS